MIYIGNGYLVKLVWKVATKYRDEHSVNYDRIIMVTDCDRIIGVTYLLLWADACNTHQMSLVALED